MRAWFLPVVAVTVLASGCGSDSVGGGAQARPASPDPWTGPVSLATLPDINPDPQIVEVNLTAASAEWQYAPGHTVHAMAYNGTVPGPLLSARVGDLVIVHFTNRLAEPTSIHWHGVRVPNAMDGSPDVQQPVPPGGTFEYRFVVPDAGTFWYHPHVDEPVQMEHGLYGPIVVRGDHEPTADAEGVLMLDDLLLGSDGQIAPPGDVLEQHGGREGNVQLVNGRSGVVLPMRAGQVQRWRVINAGSARFYNLRLPGHPITLLGTDGGPVERPVSLTDWLMVPGDRVDILVSATGVPGSRVDLQNLPYNRGHGAGLTETDTVLGVQYTTEAALPALALPTTLATIPVIAAGTTATQTVTFNEVFDPVAQTVTFTINGASYPDVPTLHARVGTTEVWDLVNSSEMDHPFHLHGFFFQVLSRNGTAPALRSQEDTIDLHGHERVRIAFQPDDRPGTWMYHCHILEHLAHGMMGSVNVAP